MREKRKYQDAEESDYKPIRKGRELEENIEENLGTDNV